MKNNHIVTAFVLVLLCGIVIGFLIGRICDFRNKRPPRPRGLQEMLERKVTRQLNLTPEQHQAVQPAYEKWLKDFIEMNRRNSPEVKKIFFALYDDIEKTIRLTPEQQRELASIRARTVEHITFKGKFKIPEKETGEPAR